MIEAIQGVDNAVLAIVGDGDVVPDLKVKVIENQWMDKVLFFGKRPYVELLQFTMLSDVGVSMDKDTNPNYRYALGNKIFDYINAGVALFVSDLPEVSKIVKKYDIGEICPSHDVAVITTHLNDLLNDTERLLRLKENTKKAAAELTWDNEKKVLKQIYLNE